MSKIVKATFKGRDGSCGFKTNTEYELTIWHKIESNIKVEEPQNGYSCHYESMESLLSNWDNIRNK